MNTDLSGSTAPQKRHFRRIALYVFFALCVATLVVYTLPSFLVVFGKDVPPPQDGDLQVTRVTISKEQNGYEDMTQAAAALQEPIDLAKRFSGIVDGTDWDEAYINNLLTQNAGVSPLVTSAVTKPIFQDPLYAVPASITFASSVVNTSLNGWRGVARVTLIDALSKAKQGDTKGALDEALAVSQITQKIEASNAPLLEYLVTIAIQSSAAQVMRNVAHNSTMTSVDLAPYIRSIAAEQKSAESGLVTAFKLEYLFHKAGISEIASRQSSDTTDTSALAATTSQEVAMRVLGQRSKNRYYFRPNEVIKDLAADARGLIVDSKEPCNVIGHREKTQQAPNSVFFLYVTPNATGKLLHDISTISLLPAIIKKCEDQLTLSATATVFALKAFHTDHGDYPAELSELVPQYLEAIPYDPFSGLYLKYSREKKIIYSVGKDNKDDGGSSGDNWATMPDPTFSLE